MLACALARARFDAFAFGFAWRALGGSPTSWSAARSVVWSGAFVDWDPASACFVLFFVGAFVARLGRRLRAPGPRSVHGAAPGGSLLTAVLPGEREEASVRHAGPADARGGVGPLAGLRRWTSRDPSRRWPVRCSARGVARRAVHLADEPRLPRCEGERESCRRKDVAARPAGPVRVTALLDATTEAVEVDHHVDALSPSTARLQRARRRARPGRPPRRVPRRPDRPDVGGPRSSHDPDGGSPLADVAELAVAGDPLRAELAADPEARREPCRPWWPSRCGPGCPCRRSWPLPATPARDPWRSPARALDLALRLVHHEGLPTEHLHRSRCRSAPTSPAPCTPGCAVPGGQRHGRHLVLPSRCPAMAARVR